MGKRALLAMAAVVAVVAVGGIGFASWTATVTVGGTATAGTPSLEWNSGALGGGYPTVISSSPGYLTCPSAYSGPSSPGAGGATTMTITAQYFAPGDACTVHEPVQNDGNVGLSLSTNPSITANGASVCAGWSISDTLGVTSLNPGQATLFTVTVSLSPAASAANCASTSASISDTITGTT